MFKAVLKSFAVVMTFAPLAQAQIKLSTSVSSTGMVDLATNQRVIVCFDAYSPTKGRSYLARKINNFPGNSGVSNFYFTPVINGALSSNISESNRSYYVSEVSLDSSQSGGKFISSSLLPCASARSDINGGYTYINDMKSTINYYTRTATSTSYLSNPRLIVHVYILAHKDGDKVLSAEVAAEYHRLVDYYVRLGQGLKTGLYKELSIDSPLVGATLERVYVK